MGSPGCARADAFRYHSLVLSIFVASLKLYNHFSKINLISFPHKTYSNLFHSNFFKMKDFLLVFRTDYTNMPKGTIEEQQATTKRWMDWIGGISAQNKLTDKGNRLDNTGRIVKSNVITNGPYTEIKESIGGYSVIKSASYEDAVEIAKACPILSLGGSVEVREVSPL